MKLKHWMTRNPITVGPDDSLIDASRIMKANRLRRLPVVDKDKLVGMITYRNVIEASPSAATSLSVHELNYLIANLKVKDVMTKSLVTVDPDESAIDVILMGAAKGIGAFPVLKDQRLVGIVTEAEIVNMAIAMFGDPAENSIICVEGVRLRSRVGQLANITSIIAAENVPVMGVFSIPHRDNPGHRVYIRLATKSPEGVIKALEEKGYKVGD